MNEIDVKKVGIAIKTLRQKLSLTQKDVADALLVSDKAVSKWERGGGLPDVSLLNSLAMILDTDVESLLEGNATFIKKDWIGFMDLGDYEIDIDTVIGSQSIFTHQISYLMLSGISRIYIKTTPRQKRIIKEDIKSINIVVCFVEDYSIINKHNTMFINGPFFIYGVGLSRTFQKAMERKGMTVFCVSSKENKMDGVRFNYYHELANNKTATETLYKYCPIPMMLFTKGRFIHDYAVSYNEVFEKLKGETRSINIEPLLRGYIYIPILSKKDFLDADKLVKIIQERDFEIANLKEIQQKRGFL